MSVSGLLSFSSDKQPQQHIGEDLQNGACRDLTRTPTWSFSYRTNWRLGFPGWRSSLLVLPLLFKCWLSGGRVFDEYVFLVGTCERSLDGRYSSTHEWWGFVFFFFINIHLPRWHRQLFVSFPKTAPAWPLHLHLRLDKLWESAGLYFNLLATSFISSSCLVVPHQRTSVTTHSTGEAGTLITRPRPFRLHHAY